MQSLRPFKSSLFYAFLLIIFLMAVQVRDLAAQGETLDRVMTMTGDTGGDRPLAVAPRNEARINRVGLDEPLEQFLKGVQAILNGELWFSRKTTSSILMETQYRRSNLAAAEAMLTSREKEILIAIASGSSNSDIAEECFISPNTVKTHLYNIYKKIGVKNRLEATLWVARYL